MYSKPVKAKKNDPAQQVPRQIQVSTHTHEKHEVSFSPVPPADELVKLEQVQPGITERILRMAEKEQEERLNINKELTKLENKNLQNINTNVRVGLFLGFGSVLVTTVMCMYFAYLGGIEAAANTAKWVIVALAGLFITGRIFKSKENKE